MAHPPDAARSEKQVDRAVHVAELNVIAIRIDVDGDANAARCDKLGPGAVNGFDQSPAELIRVFQIKRDQARRSVGLIERIGRIEKDRSAIGRQEQLANGFACRKNEAPVIKIDLDLNSATIRGVGFIDMASTPP